jgi:uncharacterized protein YgiM (DUF1202 family)
MRVGLIFFLVSIASAGFAADSTFCVNKSGAILRSAPDSSAPQSWKVPKFMPLQGTGARKGAWVEVVDVDGQKHWANTKDLSPKITCLVVKARKVQLRTGPGAEYDPSPAGVADRYTTFLDLGGEDGWTQVEDEMGQRGWINLDQIWKPRKKMRMSFDGE